MRGKIDKDGYLWKEVPGGKWIKCDCVNWACGENDCAPICRHDCVAFDGPFPDGRCTVNACPHATMPCAECEHYKPCIAVKICQGRTLQFDGFEDERVPK